MAIIVHSGCIRAASAGQKGYGENGGLVFWHREQQQEQNGSRTGVVIGSGPTGGSGRVRYFVRKKGAPWSLSTSGLVTVLQGVSDLPFDVQICSVFDLHALTLVLEVQELELEQMLAFFLSKKPMLGQYP
ncbi:hypothetical protein Tco_0975598 [Tanacetum coccineum]|uniref:Uncharacterized protein n=1 Tax=Tanacetum coccineum TaxID=301880 RepID=A0ABQ5EEV1_9ASTR